MLGNVLGKYMGIRWVVDVMNLLINTLIKIIISKIMFSVYDESRNLYQTNGRFWLDVVEMMIASLYVCFDTF